jgi:alpha-beta hydrolase superfamily lysophospholipase
MNVEVEEVGFPSGELELYGRLRTAAEDAPTIVLLCGLGFHTFEYEPLATWLAAGGVNCLSFDFRGHGRSGGRRGRWVLDQLVVDSRHAIDFARTRYRGPIGLFGNSLGAMVAILTGSRDDRVLGVAAANCPVRIADFLLTRPRRALFAVAKLVAPILPMRISVNHFYSYEQLIEDRAWVSTFERDPLIADARRLSVATYSSLLQHWNGCSAVGDLRRPLLLIQGRHDRMQPPQQSRLLFEAANDPKGYETVDTGHLPHLEDPGTLAELLAAWFSGLIGCVDTTVRL